MDKNIHIGIACNRYDSTAGVVEQELMSVGNNIKDVLQSRGYTTSFLDFNNIENVLSEMKEKKPDLIFNVCERINDNASLEPHAASLLEIVQVPYTGSSPLTLSLCVDKIKMKQMLSFHNIPTPKWDFALTADDTLKEMKYPLIVKPSNTHNSIGITNDSVVEDEASLRKQIHKIVTEFDCPVIVEEYLDGDEYSVAILGNPKDHNLKILPISAYRFENLPEEYWKICAFDAKWITDSILDRSIRIERNPQNLDQSFKEKIIKMAVDTYTILECRDYGRVDIKTDREGNPYVLELNQNPSINEKDCAVTEVARSAGISYGDLLEEIIGYALIRNKKSI